MVVAPTVMVAPTMMMVGVMMAPRGVMPGVMPIVDAMVMREGMTSVPMAPVRGGGCACACFE